VPNMSSLPHPNAKQRTPRVHLEGITPAVLRFSDGQRVSGKLQVISITGGLLCLPRPAEQGSRVKLMFLTSTGSVLGVAEMLSPVSWDLQPFRFVRLCDDDLDRLHSAIQWTLKQSHRDQKQSRRGHEQIERGRSR